MKPATQPATKSANGWRFSLDLLARVLFCCFVLACSALPSLAAGDSAPDPADTPVGTVFRWLNFVLVFGGLACLLKKYGGPYFRGRAREISASIREALDARAAAARQLAGAGERLDAVDLEIQDLRRAAAYESAAEADRIRALASAESKKIALAAEAEIAAAERVARHELRAVAARVATERAAQLVRSRLTAVTETALFRSFLDDLGRSAS